MADTLQKTHAGSREAGSIPAPSTITKHHIMDKATFTRRVSGGTRIYYIDTHKDTKGAPYIAISEVPTDRSKGPKKRQRIFLHPEHLDEFQQALSDAIDNIKAESK